MGDVKSIAPAAERCLVSTCALLTVTSVRNENFDMWVSVLRDVLPDSEGCGSALYSVWVSAEQVVSVRRGKAQDAAMIRLRWDVQQYLEMAAANRFEAWKQAKSEGV